MYLKIKSVLEKKLKKKKENVPTYPNLKFHVIGNTHIFFLA